MALACRPDVLLADEPTTALDVTVQAAVLELLDDAVRRHGMSLVFVSHDLAVVAGVVDRAIVLRRGEAVEEGAAVRARDGPGARLHPAAGDRRAPARVLAGPVERRGTGPRRTETHRRMGPPGRGRPRRTHDHAVHRGSSHPPVPPQRRAGAAGRDVRDRRRPEPRVGRRVGIRQVDAARPAARAAAADVGPGAVRGLGARAAVRAPRSPRFDARCSRSTRIRSRPWIRVSASARSSRSRSAGSRPRRRRVAPGPVRRAAARSAGGRTRRRTR